MLYGKLSLRGQGCSEFSVTEERENYRNSDNRCAPSAPLRSARSAQEQTRHSSANPLNREELYAEFEPLVRRLIRQYGGTAELRHDLLGEIYYRFCAILEAYDPDRGIPLHPYIVRQLTATTYTYVRQNWRIASREMEIKESQADCGFGWEEDPTMSWLQSLSQQQVASQLPEAMERIPRRQRQVVIWRYYEERSFEEIAGLLCVQPATVRSLLRHGLTNLRKYIQDSGDSMNEATSKVRKG